MDIQTTVTENIIKKTLHNFWHNAFLPKSNTIKNIVNPNNRINYEITNPLTNELYHFACFEVHNTYIPNGMKLKVIPPQKYAVFTPEKPLNALEYSSLVSFVYGEWLPISGYQLASDYTFDVMYRERNKEKSICTNMEVYIPIK